VLQAGRERKILSRNRSRADASVSGDLKRPDFCAHGRAFILYRKAVRFVKALTFGSEYCFDGW